MDNVYNWQFNCLPGSANQGAILMTRNDILRPPFTQDDFIWVAMEDVIGTADVRLTYNETTNIYTLEKAIGHRNNNGEWIKDWYVVGSWERLSQEVVEILRQLVYVEYRFDTSIPNVLKVIGVKKDLSEVVLCDISFVSLQEFNQAIETLDDKITAETTRATAREDEIAEDLSDEVTRATQRENELQAMIEAATMNPGRAIEVTAEKVINVLIDNDSIKTNNSNQLKADVFSDTEVRNDKGWSSAKISQEMTSAFHYKGQVATYADLPTTGMEIGDTYNVADTGDNYVWNGTSWDNMAGEYIAGVGIRIDGKVITATGIAFQVGNGLEVTGSGDQAVLAIKNNNNLIDANKAPLQADSNGGFIKVNTSKGITSGPGTQNGIEIKLQSPLTFNNAGYVRLETEDGIHIKANNKIGINANFTNVSEPLGTNDSNIIKYSDGKIGVESVKKHYYPDRQRIVNERLYENSSSFVGNHGNSMLFRTFDYTITEEDIARFKNKNAWIVLSGQVNGITQDDTGYIRILRGIQLRVNGMPVAYNLETSFINQKQIAFYFNNTISFDKLRAGDVLTVALGGTHSTNDYTFESYKSIEIFYETET